MNEMLRSTACNYSMISSSSIEALECKQAVQLGIQKQAPSSRLTSRTGHHYQILPTEDVSTISVSASSTSSTSLSLQPSLASPPNPTARKIFPSQRPPSPKSLVPP